MAYSSMGFDDVNRSLYNAALRILGLFWIFYFWIVFNLFSAQVSFLKWNTAGTAAYPLSPLTVATIVVVVVVVVVGVPLVIKKLRFMSSRNILGRTNGPTNWWTQPLRETPICFYMGNIFLFIHHHQRSWHQTWRWRRCRIIWRPWKTSFGNLEWSFSSTSATLDSKRISAYTMLVSFPPSYFFYDEYTFYWPSSSAWFAW